MIVYGNDDSFFQTIINLLYKSNFQWYVSFLLWPVNFAILSCWTVHLELYSILCTFSWIHGFVKTVSGVVYYVYELLPDDDQYCTECIFFCIFSIFSCKICIFFRNLCMHFCLLRLRNTQITLASLITVRRNHLFERHFCWTGAKYVWGSMCTWLWRQMFSNLSPLCQPKRRMTDINGTVCHLHYIALTCNRVMDQCWSYIVRPAVC